MAHLVSPTQIGIRFQAFGHAVCSAVFERSSSTTFDRRMSSLRWGNVIQFRDGRHLDALGGDRRGGEKNAVEADAQNEPMPSLGDVYRDKFLLGN